MLKVKRFINQLMTSNCYIIYEDGRSTCVVIDPGSKDCFAEIKFFEENNLYPEYIILTHEHTDHTWGCNALVEKYNSKIVCSKECASNLDKESRAYFLFYFDDVSYTYKVKQPDILIEDINKTLVWNKNVINFIITPGHSKGSICIWFDKMMFTGDSFMQYKDRVDKRNCSLSEYMESKNKIIKLAERMNLRIFPGHGVDFSIEIPERKLDFLKS